MHTPQIARRGPDGMAAELLQITVGCSYGKCHFCSLHGNAQFQAVPMEHVVEDIEEIAATVRNPKSVMLLSEDPMGLPNSKLIPILKLIREKLPTAKGISGFMTTASVKRKSDEDLREMAQYGPLKATIGAESGWDEALERMEKDHTTQDLLDNLPRLEKAGITYVLFYLCGMAGKGKCHENALRSAEVFSKLHPAKIFITTMTPFPGTKLREEVLDGSFELAPESEIINEAATFVENLRCETVVVSGHDTNLFRIEGVLPRDGKDLAAMLRWRAENTDDDRHARLRLDMAPM
ncbi:radical SAM protein [Eggerthellaceae bacterium zg-886]|uniref:Radical SAM protein n=2 Tax=Xiamenia xianingshaonis TaxID=2682776 RepID=A0ABX0IGR9_9ACTN|nr:radical SAM protein [Xiamenia xianingshaonis]